MPKRTDIRSILLIGSGPIVIGQACEFDYSGTQACKALREEGYRVVLVNSNPATIMTDPEFAHRTYIEPLTLEMVTRVIERERPDALLPTLGGQTALNLAVRLAETGVLERYGVQLIGASVEAIRKAEDRQRFKEAMLRIGLEVPRSATARSLAEARAVLDEVGLPAIIRPSFTLGGTGGSLVETRAEFDEKVARGLAESPAHEVLIEESIAGWKEFELEVMRDHADNVVIICSIENLDPMGVHTGDSITVAPVQTLTDREYQRMRDAAIAVIREIGVDTGGSNIQFAVDPATGRQVVIEMNPRVSRSSALASKATGYPIAKIAAKLAVGYRLDELTNDITGTTPASFEPTLDYVVVKIPRFAFEKFPGTDPTLGSQMKSVGEVMAIGRTFKEAYQKALRSLETGSLGLEPRVTDPAEVRRRLARPTPERPWLLADAIRLGVPLEELYALTRIDPWFLDQMAQLVEHERRLAAAGAAGLTPERLRAAKRDGFSDHRIGELVGLSEAEVRARRLAAGIRPTFKMVDTCAAEFEARTPYLYSTYETEDEAPPTDRRKVVILGSGPNRIGQGIEFDYCCVHGVLALREAGYETVMVNCNPETVSTDYDISDRLYFEPLTFEDVFAVLERERPVGVILQFGGQTPLKLARALEAAGFPIWGTSADAIDIAEDRARFRALIEAMGLKQPASGAAREPAEAEAIAARLGFPLLVRPSYVLGGRAMEVIPSLERLRAYMDRALGAAGDRPVLPILVDKYLEAAIEVDVDAVADGEEVWVGGVLEHIEEAGVHSGDAACVLPPYTLPAPVVEALKAQTRALARALRVVGLLNVQFAVQGGEVYVLEVNPRASRTVPFVSKAIGRPLAKLAARVMAGARLRDLLGGAPEPARFTMVAVKEAVLPFDRFPGVDVLLGPEMKSTGEVMGLAPTFDAAYAKAQLAAGPGLPTRGRAFLSVRDADKPAIASIAKSLYHMEFELVATRGTAARLAEAGLPVTVVNKVVEGPPHIVEAIAAGRIDLVINTTEGEQSIADSYSIRRAALLRKVPYFTTVAGARAAVRGIAALRRGQLAVAALQDIPAA
ncbi:MAG TPA: carbamoyl-phosphate synthase large subunit [Thermodesulfobacteriota bacterium]|nr:carbamoyl-phosphate synthase large subunit [Thermodesulfobacteriota bacterium]